MSNASQMNKDAEKLEALWTQISEESRNLDIAKEMASEHRTLQQSFTRLCISWIRHCAGLEEWQFDGRNELSVKVCKDLKDALDEKGYGSLPMI